MFLASQGAPTWAPNGPQIAFRASFGLEIYENRVREGSERAPRPKKSSRRGSRERKKVVKTTVVAVYGEIWPKIEKSRWGRRHVAGPIDYV